MSLYLALNLAAIAVPFLFSFHPRLKFVSEWKYFFPALVITGSVFVAWDVLFTVLGVWSFNPDYLLGIYFLGLPLEEFLFFICIPFASVFTFHCFRKILPGISGNTKVIKYSLLAVAILLAAVGLWQYEKWYTVTTFLFAAFSLVISVAYFRSILGYFLLSYAVILVPFFIINGILTGSFIEGEVVRYNNAENLGIRLFTIPLEDVFYGLSLLLWNVMLTDLFRSKFADKSTSKHEPAIFI